MMMTMIDVIEKSVLKFSFISLFLLLACTTASFAQTDTTDEELAAQYYQSKEYDKASILYEKLFTKKQDYIYYSPYLECLIKLKEYKQAEKMIKKQVKLHPYTPQYSVDLGYLYNSEGKEKDAKEEYESLIKNVPKEKQAVIDLANAFLLRDETDDAIQTYLKARKAMTGSYPFNLELADIYKDEKDYDKMMDEYISLIEYSTYYMDEVQGMMQTIIEGEADTKQSTALKNVLLLRIKDKPDETMYAELLLWYSIQMKDFENRSCASQSA